MSPACTHPTGPPFRFPRVSGDEPMREINTTLAEAFSPRERG